MFGIPTGRKSSVASIHSHTWSEAGPFPQTVHPSIHHPYPSVHPSVHPQIHQSIRLSFHPSIRPSIRPSVCPSIRQSARPSIHHWSLDLTEAVLNSSAALYPVYSAWKKINRAHFCTLKLETSLPPSQGTDGWWRRRRERERETGGFKKHSFFSSFPTFKGWLDTFIFIMAWVTIAPRQTDVLIYKSGLFFFPPQKTHLLRDPSQLVCVCVCVALRQDYKNGGEMSLSLNPSLWVEWSGVHSTVCLVNEWAKSLAAWVMSRRSRRQQAGCRWESLLWLRKSVSVGR